MPAVLAIPAFWAAVGSGAAASGAIVAANETSGATESAANTQATTAANSLAFQKQQAEVLFNQQQQTAKANYDQWVAQQTQMNKVRAELGIPTLPIPAYVPLQDPNLTGAAPTSTVPATTTPTPAPTTPPAAAVAAGVRPSNVPSDTPPVPGAPTTTAPTSMNGQDPAAYARTLLAKGMAPQQVAATVSSSFGVAAQYQPTTGTIQIPGQAPILVGSVVQPQSVGAYLQPQQPTTGPQPYQQPQSVGSYLQGVA